MDNTKTKMESKTTVKITPKTIIKEPLFDAKGSNIIIFQAEHTCDNQIYVVPPGKDWNQIVVLVGDLFNLVDRELRFEPPWTDRRRKVDSIYKDLYNILKNYKKDPLGPSMSFIHVGPSLIQVMTYW